jgi:hypothetical protein
MNILILEDDAKLQEDFDVARYGKKMKAEGHEVKYVFNAYDSSKEIVKLINWADVLAFHTTFTYLRQIYVLAQAIAQYRKEPLTVLIDSYDHDRHIQEMVQLDGYKFESRSETFYLDQELVDEFAYKLRNLKLFKLSWRIEHEPITVLEPMIQRHQLKLDIINKYMESRRTEQAKTGRMIRIKNTNSFGGQQWSVLKTGMVLPEIDMSMMDPDPNRGAWVMGKDEPVKILNEHPYDEFEFVVRTLHDLTEEFIKKCSVPVNEKNFAIVIGLLKDDELDIHDRAKLICDSLNVERRFNKSYMMDRMRKLNAQFKFEEKVKA